MAVELPMFPEEEVFTYEIDLDTETFTFRFEYKERLRSWYLTYFDADGVCIEAGRRVTPRASPQLRFDTIPGFLYVVGPDPYAKEDLGEAVRVFYYTRAEVGR